MTESLIIIPRSLISLLTLFLIINFMGKKQVSQLSLFDYVIGSSIGNFTAEMTMDVNGNYMNGVFAIISFLFSFFLSFLFYNEKY